MKIWTVLKRGFCRQCPQCGTQSMFSGYLTIQSPPCKSCGLSFETIRSDDIPTYFTVLITGHLVLPSMLFAEQSWAWSSLQHFVVWLPVTILLVLGILPFIKGAVMAVIWLSKNPEKNNN